MSSQDPLKLISQRIKDLSVYLSDEHTTLLAAQRHLDAQAGEHVYWHAGYRSALIDVVRLLQCAAAVDHSVDTLSDSPSDVQDGRSCH